jgi:hypothetical protein
MEQSQPIIFYQVYYEYKDYDDLYFDASVYNYRTYEESLNCYSNLTDTYKDDYHDYEEDVYDDFDIDFEYETDNGHVFCSIRKVVL